MEDKGKMLIPTLRVVPPTAPTVWEMLQRREGGPEAAALAVTTAGVIATKLIEVGCAAGHYDRAAVVDEAVAVTRGLLIGLGAIEEG